MMHLSRRLASLSALTLLAVSGSAFADELLFEDFEDSIASGWTANGVDTIYEFGGNPDRFLALPYGDFWGVSLSARAPESMVLGDLTKVGPIRLTFDAQIFQAHTFLNDNLDMSKWPMVFEIITNGNEKAGIPYSSVYFIKGTWPQIQAGWSTYTFDVPNPSSETLPDGWGGTGDSDPVTGEPMLPVGTTYREVLSHVDEVRVTTFVPGHFYISNFWEVGFDNVRVESTGETPCHADFNRDDIVNSQDFFDFLNAFFGNAPTADFNNDGSVNSQDFFDFLTAFFAGC